MTIFDHLVPPFEYYSGSQQILDSNKNVVLNLAAWHVLQHVPKGAELMRHLGAAVAHGLNQQAHLAAQLKGDSAMISKTLHVILPDLKFKPGCE